MARTFSTGSSMLMCRTLRSRIRSSRATSTRNAVLPMPARLITSPTLPLPRPPWIERSNTRMGLRSLTSFWYISVSSVRLVAAGGLLLEPLLAELFRDLRGSGSVPGEFHGELGLALSGRAQNGGVAEHLAQRDVGVETNEAGVLGGSDHHAATLHERAQDLALELGGTLHRHEHDRLEGHGLALEVELAERTLGRGLEGVVARVHRVVVPVAQHELEVHDRVADELT